LKMIEGTSVTQHLNNFNTTTNQLSSIEIVWWWDSCTHFASFTSKQLGRYENSRE
jgi:hypothetical protein